MFDALIDTGINIYIFISYKFVNKLIKYLKLKIKTDFPLGYIRLYKNIKPNLIL